MRIFPAAQFLSYFCRIEPLRPNVQSQNFSSSYSQMHVTLALDEGAFEQKAEWKIGWVLKLIFAGTAIVVGYQSVSLLQVKDPLFKRMALFCFATDDKRRMKILEMGGTQEQLNMLGAAKDDKTRKEALKALVTLSHSDEVIGVLHQAGALSVIRSTPNSVEDAEVEKYMLSLLTRFQDMKFDVSS